MADATAGVISAILESEAGRIGPDIHTKSLNSSVWTTLVPVESFPDEMGESIKILTWERARALNAGKTAIEKQTWAPITASNGEAGGACLPPTTKLSVGTTLREYSLDQTAIESPDLCVSDLRGAFKRGVQLGALKSILSDNTNQIVVERRRDLYRLHSDHKVVVTVDGLIDDDSWTVPGSAGSKLTQGILNKYYSLVSRLGGVNNPLDRVDGAPFYGLVTSIEQSESIKQESANRDAFLYSSRVGDLLKPLGVSFAFKGFTHIVDPLPPRFNIVGGVWTEIQPWVPEAISSSGHGYKLVPNTAYDEAVWEESFIFLPAVYSAMVPNSITNAGGDVSFDPVSYRGEWKWMNVQDRVINPDKTIGYFRGVYADGAKPNLTELGVTFRHLRCDLPLDLTTCNS